MRRASNAKSNYIRANMGAQEEIVRQLDAGRAAQAKVASLEDEVRRVKEEAAKVKLDAETAQQEALLAKDEAHREVSRTKDYASLVKQESFGCVTWDAQGTAEVTRRLEETQRQLEETRAEASRAQEAEKKALERTTSLETEAREVAVHVATLQTNLVSTREKLDAQTVMTNHEKKRADEWMKVVEGLKATIIQKDQALQTSGNLLEALRTKLSDVEASLCAVERERNDARRDRDDLKQRLRTLKTSHTGEC